MSSNFHIFTRWLGDMHTSRETPFGVSVQIVFLVAVQVFVSSTQFRLLPNKSGMIG
jgi:hypothetical protein